MIKKKNGKGRYMVMNYEDYEREKGGEKAVDEAAGSRRSG